MTDWLPMTTRSGWPRGAARVEPETQAGLGVELGDVDPQLLAASAFVNQPGVLADLLVGLTPPRRPDLEKQGLRAEQVARAEQARRPTGTFLDVVSVRADGQGVAGRRAHQW